MPQNPLERNRSERRLAWLLVLVLAALALAPGAWYNGTTDGGTTAKPNPAAAAP